jgi:hypothetical protein
MKKKASIALAAACVLLHAPIANAQQALQKLNDATVSEVAAQWKSPHSEFGPEPYYGLNGSVSLEQVRRDLDTLHGLGFRAVTVQAGFGMPFAYLSPEYFAFFRSFVAEAKQRDMRVWIVDDAGYPSGFAGGKFSALSPQLRMQALEVSQKVPVAGGTTLRMDLPEAVVSAAAVDQDGAAMPLTLKDHHLEWTAPAGIWTVLLVDHEFRTSPTRSDTNTQRVKDTSQSLEDYLDPAATRQYLAYTHEQYKQYVGEEFGKTILGFRGDEPDFSISGLPWTPKFFERFRQLKGYDIQPYAALFAQTPNRRDPGISIHLTAEQVRIKADYYDVFSQMFAAGFFDPLSEWCAANHLRYQFHLNHEEMEMDLVRSEGSFFRDMRSVQVPGIDTIWHQIWKDTISDFPRLASSAAHLYGRPQAFTESFAAYRPAPDVEMARYILNEQFVRGVNLVETMYFPATSAGPKPPPSYMGEAGFPELLTYVRRMSYLMTVGRPDASVALLLPASSLWLGSEPTDTAFVSTERLLSEHQIDFDDVDEDELARDLKAIPGGFETRSGNRYRTVIVPAAQLISADVLERLKTFAKGGGKVVFLGGAPKWIAGANIRDGEQAATADFAWATVIDATLPPTPTPPAFPPTEALQAQVVPSGVVEGIVSAVAAPSVQSAVPDTALRVMKRKWRDADVYLLFNEGSAAIDHPVTLSGEGRIAEAWDAQTGQVAPIAQKHSAGHATIQLRLQPYEATVIVLR